MISALTPIMTMIVAPLASQDIRSTPETSTNWNEPTKWHHWSHAQVTHNPSYVGEFQIYVTKLLSWSPIMHDKHHSIPKCLQNQPYFDVQLQNDWMGVVEGLCPTRATQITSLIYNQTVHYKKSRIISAPTENNIRHLFSSEEICSTHSSVILKIPIHSVDFWLVLLALGKASWSKVFKH